MSQIHDGPLATYSSLTDRNLAGYFANTRMRRHLRKAGLVNKRGQIVSENQYRLNMARKEHKKHVKDLLAQAIVHKTLDIERNRQVEIKRKLEEISKLELVRRVRAQKFRKGDEDILPYLSPRSSRPASRYRPRSAPADRQYNDSYEADVIYVDDEGRPVTPPKEIDEEVGGKREEIDTRHLYALDSAALKKYALTLSKIEQGEGLSSPYLISQAPSPPQSARASTRNTYRDARYKPRLHRPRTANSLSPYRSQRTGAVQGTLMLHRQEPAMMHQGEVQTLCEVTMKYYGPNLILPRDQRDPTQDVEIEQQHCGGNTLPVFKERIKPGDEFTFISRRHRGYPFSLSIFVDGRISARVSTCCEYGHAKGVRLGGKMGQFCLKSITGATPCYKCKLNAQASPRTLKRPPTKKKQEVEEIKEEIIVLRPEKKKQEEEDKYDDDFEDDDSKKDSGTEKYNDDFESEEDERSKTPQPSKRTRSRSSSSSSSSSSSRSRSRTPTPRKDPDDNRKIYGLRADEDVKKGGSDSERSDLPVKVLGHSDEDEQPESKKWTERQVKEKKQRRSSYSSTSSSSSTRSRDSIKQKNKEVKKSQVIETTTDETKTESTTSDAHVSVDTEPKQRSVRRKSSSSSSSSSDSEDNVKKYSEKLEEDERRREEEQRLEVRREEERRRQEEQRKVDIRREEEMRREEEKRKREEEKRRLEEEQRRVDVRMEEERRKEEEKRKRDEEFRKSSHEQKREEEQRRWAEEESKRRVEERRKREHEEVQRREAYAKRKETAHISSTPDMDYVPEPVSYSRIYEEERVEALKSIKQGQTRYAKSSSSSSSSSESERDEPYKKSSATEKKMSPSQSPAKVTPPRSAATSSSSRESETDTDADKKAKNTLSAAHRVPSPIKGSSSSSSSSSDSDTDTGKVKKQLTPPRTPSPAKVTPPRSAVDSSSSSSSDSETETDTDRRVTSSTVKTSPVKVEPKVIKEERESSSSSSSDSETETDNEKIPKKVNTPPQPLVPIVETKRRDESSSSETDTETDNEKVKKETEQQKERLSSIKENVVKSSGTSSTSGTSSSSSDSETDTERTKTAETLPSVQEKKKEEVKAEVKKDTTTTSDSSSGSSDSSSDSSDSEDEEKKKNTGREKLEQEEPALPPVGKTEEKTISDEPFISESEGEQRTVTIFASESDGDNMHGGNDPDNLASGNPEVKSYLSKIGVAPGQPVPGTIAHMMEGKKDLELSNIALSSSQVTEVGDFLSKGDNLKSVCLRNAGIDDAMFESIADSLIATKSNPLMLNFNLNKMKDRSVEKLVELLVYKPSIEILLLHGNPLGDEGVKLLVNGILDIHQAFSHREAEEKKVEGTKNNMDDVEQEVTTETTKYCVLKELDLGDTDISDEGIGHIAHLLENDSDLRTLNLNGNARVSYTGWKRLSKALKRNKTLQSLTLDFNKIGDEGIAALVSGLKVNTSLQTLDLESTGLTDQGGKMLAELVKCNTTILDITVLPGNKILDKTQDEIRNYLGLNKAASAGTSKK